jgi:hypothetical protein
MTTVPEGNDVDVSSGAHFGFDGALRTGSDATLTTSCGALLPVLSAAGSIMLTANAFPTKSIAKALKAARAASSAGHTTPFAEPMFASQMRAAKRRGYRCPRPRRRCAIA